MERRDDASDDISVEVVIVDYYMKPPLPANSLHGLPDSPCYLLAHEVPVIRVFGSTPAGQKACVHIHGVFPYFYIRVENDPVFDDAEQLALLLPRIAMDLEKANQLNRQKQRQESNQDKTQHPSRLDRLIAKLLIVQGIPFYGYHPHSQLFIQLFLYSPRMISTVVQLLESGCIAERKFQPYEAHIPFILQVLADYNLEGMNPMYLSHVKFRAPLPTTQQHLGIGNQDNSERVYLKSNVSSAIVNGDMNSQFVEGRTVHVHALGSNWFDRQSICALEIDVAAECIMNSRRLQTSILRDEKLQNVPSLAALWDEERQRRVLNGHESTVDTPLSIVRDVDAFLANEVASSAALSQSMFRQQMKDSVHDILQEAHKRFNRSLSSVSTAHLDHAYDNVPWCSSSISTQSRLSFSQAEDEVHVSIDMPEATNEDTAILSVLYSMHQTVRKVSVAEKDDSEGEEEGCGDTDQTDMVDILSSQRLHETESVDNSKSGAWWDVMVGDNATCINSVVEMGSPRINSVSNNASTLIRFEKENFYESHAQEQNQTPPRATVTTDEGMNDTESYPFDPQLISLTPQPIVRQRRQPRDRNSKTTTAEKPILSRLKNKRIWMGKHHAPSLEQLQRSSHALGIYDVEYQPAFYSNECDIPDKPIVFGGTTFDFARHGVAPFDTYLLRKLRQPELNPCMSWMGLAAQKNGSESSIRNNDCHAKVNRVRAPARLPPTKKDVSDWLHVAKQISDTTRKRCRVETPLTSSMETRRLSPGTFTSNLTNLSIEIHVNTRGVLQPHPLYDRVEVICYAVEAQEGPQEDKTKEQGVLLLVSESDIQHHAFCIASSELCVRVAKDERELLTLLEELVLLWDPDFLTGYEVQKESIGYLIDRATHLGVELTQSLSRLPWTKIDGRNVNLLPPDEKADEVMEEMDENKSVSIGTTWGVTKASGLWIHGRHVLNIWRLARSEVKLPKYSREDVVRAIMKREIPKYSSAQLTSWFRAGGELRWKVIRHTLRNAAMNHSLISRMQLITRTSEMARLFGMQFYSVLSRGSQFRVEAVMLRVTKRKNYLLLSASRPQVAAQAPMECIPLVMEPHSSFYPDPVVVLDFQSLYPSLVIAYNLCYSTLFGRLANGLDPDVESSLGVVKNFTVSIEGLIASENDKNMIIAPNGTLFSSKLQRPGVLPVILDEILSTRIMVKEAMKAAKKRNQDKLEKVLNARQLALKLLANVTYGYTAAGFSGRMPCAQLADSIVQFGRCTLEAAIRLVESHPNWNAKVVYGDTDSLFVLLRGRSKEEAFSIGQEIADAVTASNPKPVTLKLEKVYLGSILVSKKRYVGYKYEHSSQERGEIESKGIEIVRRDSCGVVQESMRKCLQLLFTSRDLSDVKKCLENYWACMLNDELPLKCFVFAKEVRLGTYARGSAPPAALVSVKAMTTDPRSEPRYAERVPYVVVNGPPGARLMDLVVSPDEFINGRHRGLAINHQYYIHKQMIPSLERLFLLIGANVRAWYAQMPRIAGKSRIFDGGRSVPAYDNRSIDSFYVSNHCRLCGNMGQLMVCDECQTNRQRTEFVRQVLTSYRDKKRGMIQGICSSCGDRDSIMSCINLSCSVWNTLQLVESD